MATTIDDRVAELERANAELRRQLDARTAELIEAREQHAAASEILGAISRSPTDLQPVFEAIVASAARLCSAEFTAVARFDDGLLHLVAINNMSPEETAAFHSLFPRFPTRNFAMGRAFQDGRWAQFADVLAEPDYDARTREVLQEVARYRTFLGVPILRERRPIGVIGCARRAVEPFTETQIGLLEMFAEQAAIALENVRLLHELETRNREVGEALEQQTATAEVLQVINSSPGDLAPVFDSILDKAHALCDVAHGSLQLYDGVSLRAVATHGVSDTFADILRHGYRAADSPASRGLIEGMRFVQIADCTEIDHPVFQSAAEFAGIRTVLFVPLRRDDALLGLISSARREVRPFSDKQIALLQNFAAQAVIAIENARLINETREALEQQTATAEVLQVINSSPGALRPVFDAMLEKAMRLCQAVCGHLYTYDGERFSPAAVRGERGFAEWWEQHGAVRPRPGAGPLGRIAQGERVVVTDYLEDPAYRAIPQFKALVDAGGLRSAVAVALRKDEALLGSIHIYRQEVQPFSDKQIALLQNFAAQAVIAMENARLLTETREALEQQTATAEVLQVINSSPGDLAPVFDAMLDKAMRLCDAAHGHLYTFDGERVHPVAMRGEAGFVGWFRRLGPYRPSRGSPVERTMRGERVVHVADALQEEAYRIAPGFRELIDVSGIRTGLTVALRKEDAFIGAINVYRKEVRPFSDKQIALLQNFAAQAVIAMESARLLGEIRAARDAAETALRELQTAQASLIHAEKMASLGQLTAGIAHEIKNPLNFVNNFAGLSVELLDELKETARPALDALGGDKRAEIDEVVAMLTGNLDKIAEHGRRADGIVKSMLDHSRGEVGERRPIDLNHLVEEALSLAYHGARAQDQSFNIALERDFAPGMAPIAVVPQDITRVCLNLFGNGFYAASKRHQADGGASVKVTTRELGQTVEVRVRDNGTGIAPELRDKLFQPFFTTKPTGEGTGLGLSICWDIVTQQHGGTITVDSSLGEFTEFTVRLPRRAPAMAGRPADADAKSHHNVADFKSADDLAPKRLA